MRIKSSIFALFFLMILAFNAKSQEQGPPAEEGVIRYLVVHNWSKKMAAVDYISKQQKERIAYMWGNRSEWKTYATLHFTPTATKYEDSEEKAEPDDEGFSWRRDVYTIRRDFANNKVFDAIQMLGKTYIVEDTIDAPEWRIQNDLKEVAGHVCMNAFWEDTLKRQKINVWFALDMPVSGGPERLCGLPGLILEADFNEGAMTITANRITPQKVDKDMELPKKLKGKKIKEAEYQEVIKKHIAEKRKAEEPYFWGIRY